MAIAGQRGVLYHADQRFKSLVASAWSRDDPDRLPAKLQARLVGDVTGSRTLRHEGVILHCSREQDVLVLKARAAEAVDTLSEGEFLVARGLAGGLTHKEVATQLHRSPETIRTQIKAIFNKLDINNVALLGTLLTARE